MVKREERRFSYSPSSGGFRFVGCPASAPRGVPTASGILLRAQWMGREILLFSGPVPLALLRWVPGGALPVGCLAPGVRGSGRCSSGRVFAGVLLRWVPGLRFRAGARLRGGRYLGLAFGSGGFRAPAPGSGRPGSGPAVGSGSGLRCCCGLRLRLRSRVRRPGFGRRSRVPVRAPALAGAASRQAGGGIRPASGS